MGFLRGLTEEAQLERKGPAVLAAGVFDIYIYIYVYIYIDHYQLTSILI